MSYLQLTIEQRTEIKAYLKIGLTQTQIAELIGIHKSTLSRELKRNTGLRGYRPKQAQEYAHSKKKNARKHVRFTDVVKERVLFYLTKEWSPEQIAGYLKLHEGIHISHETIYQFIWADKKTGGDLYTHLRHGRKKKKHYGTQDRRGQIRDRISIDERPQIVAAKERTGDWEIDTIIGAHHQGALVSAVERKTQFSRIAYVPTKEAQIVAKTIVTMLKPFKDQVFTITVDNGKEFAHHKIISEELEADVYFAHPYRSWERGLNEQINGLIRQYFPKKYDFRKITKEDTLFVENRLNSRPRKLLDFKKPEEIFLNSLVALGT